ncbi:PulJ/GspJ family protein [Spirillospora albida]|uniref:PulJ/GspJ family protein n=1 Tax=Spirillospora albida TaxID=58123 RepID=UPI0004C009EF|nr:prepilin-type N-terminal cleavage/methylation domain-containing protein [Spirillospora albida]
MTPRPRPLTSRRRPLAPFRLGTLPDPSGTRTSPGRPQGDDGVTLIELTVTMTIMSVLMAMFTGAILHMTRAANATQSVASAQSQITTVYQRLDREIRYAAGISQPAFVGANQHVEYLTRNTAAPTCTGLRLDTATRRLQYRRWEQGKTPGPWTVLASDVTAKQPDPPFGLTPSETRFPFQRLRLRITAGTGKASIDVTFAALNTSSDSDTSAVCTEGRTTP